MMLSLSLYTSDAADERTSVDLGGRRIIKKKKKLIAGSVAVRRHRDNLGSDMCGSVRRRGHELL